MSVMDKQSYPDSEFAPFVDEISVSDLLSKLWRRRGLIVAIPLAALLLSFVFILFTAVKTDTPVVYFVQLQGINKGAYPNGARFSPQDLLDPEVLKEAVSVLGISVNNSLGRAIRVEYGFPTTLGIEKKYQKRLKARNLSATDIDRINAEYKRELSRITEHGLRIVVNYSDIGLTRKQGILLASAIPRAWGRVYTHKYRTLMDTRLVDAAVNAKDINLGKTSGVLSCYDLIQRIKKGLAVIDGDIRLKAVTSRSGFSAADLQTKLERFNRLYFCLIFTNSFASPDQMTNNFLFETQLHIDEINHEIDGLDRDLAYVRGFVQQPVGRQTAGGAPDMIQLGENGLKQVIDLANKASLSDYIEKILDRRQVLVTRRAALLAELKRSNSRPKKDLDQTFINNAEAKFASLVKEYTSLLSRVRQAARRNYGDFFKPLGSPEVLTPILPRRSVLILVLSVTLGVFVAVFIALALPDSRKEPDLHS